MKSPSPAPSINVAHVELHAAIEHAALIEALTKPFSEFARVATSLGADMKAFPIDPNAQRVAAMRRHLDRMSQLLQEVECIVTPTMTESAR